MHTNSNSYGDLQNDHIRIKQNLSLGGLFLQNRTFICSKDLLDSFALPCIFLKNELWLHLYKVRLELILYE